MIDQYNEAFASSSEMHDGALNVLAGGAAHDMWQMKPFPIYFEKAQGPFKWDGQGNRFIDFWMGHGAHLCGHTFEPVMAAVEAQLRRGTHFTSPHPAPVRWADGVCSLVPSAERVRFTSSGTEATMLSLRVARAYTGRKHVLKFHGHFHGWHDEVLAGYSEEAAGGRHPASEDFIALPSCLDVEAVCRRLESLDVAALIMEPGGGSSGLLPWSADSLLELRAATERAGTLLIFDEVVSGFRYSPGGVQGLVDVLPDMTVLGKILGGGFPGAAVAGRAEVMEVFGSGISRKSNRAKVMHYGTFNGNVLSSTAGAAMLEAVADGTHQAAAQAGMVRLVEGINAAAERAGIDLFAYRQSSIFHALLGARKEGVPLGPSEAGMALQERTQSEYELLRQAVLLEGLDCHPSHGWLSSSHTEEVVEDAVERFERAFVRARPSLGAAFRL